MLSPRESEVTKTLYDVLVLCELKPSPACLEVFEDCVYRSTDEEWATITYDDDEMSVQRVVEAAEKGEWAGRPCQFSSPSEVLRSVEHQLALGSCRCRRGNRAPRKHRGGWPRGLGKAGPVTP
jgi:hypothetical protein